MEQLSYSATHFLLTHHSEMSGLIHNSADIPRGKCARYPLRERLLAANK
jgi:hypothetical protein